jgi:hypothetical protein
VKIIDCGDLPDSKLQRNFFCNSSEEARAWSDFLQVRLSTLMTQWHQHINIVITNTVIKSTQAHHQHFNTPTRQHQLTDQHIKPMPSTHQHSHQHTNTSTQSSTHQHANTSTQYINM